MYNKEGKIVLFDGTSTALWQGAGNGEPCNWPIDNGELLVGHGNIVSTVTFGDAMLHVEFKEPDMPDAVGQAKGNSGVYVHGCYEIQVLDSYGIENPTKGDCGALYDMYIPLTNACKPALEWQTYDIILRAPRFDEAGNVTENGRMTVLQNGLPIHNNAILPRVTPGGITEDKVVRTGVLMLQDHGDPVRFRNIWVLPLEE